MANTFNGKRKFERDDSFVTTKWFVLGFFPLVPLGSRRVRCIPITAGILLPHLLRFFIRRLGA